MCVRLCVRPTVRTSNEFAVGTRSSVAKSEDLLICHAHLISPSGHLALLVLSTVSLFSIQLVKKKQIMG